MYDINNPGAVFGYILERSHTPKFVQIKKNPFDKIPAMVPVVAFVLDELLGIEKYRITKAGRRNPVQVKIKILVLPIIKSEKSMMAKMSQKLFFLPT